MKTHSVLLLAKELGMSKEVQKAAGSLDQYYVSSRYPDALPGGAPFEVFSIEQGNEAITSAQLILAEVSDEI